MTTSTLISNRSKTQVVTREQLHALPVPVGTTTHKPIPHGELVDVLIGSLDARGFRVAKEQYAIGSEGMKLFGALDLVGDGDRTRAIGLRAANDKSLAIQFVAGSRVLVCDNLALSGDAVVLSRKHTRGLSLAWEIKRGLDRYLRAQEAFEEVIDAATGKIITDDEAKVNLFDMTYQGHLPISIFDDAARFYFRAESLGLEDCAPRTVWGLHNACTRAVKALSPASQFSTTMRVSRALLPSAN